MMTPERLDQLKELADYPHRRQVILGELIPAMREALFMVDQLEAQAKGYRGTIVALTAECDQLRGSSP